MNPKIPTVRFEEKEVDRLISNFGIKPSPEKRQETENDLKAQKEKFLELERERQAREKGGKDRTV